MEYWTLGILERIQLEVNIKGDLCIVLYFNAFYIKKDVNPQTETTMFL